MKAVILAGGYGTRISEESYLRPKPMIEIGGYPILWHIMKHFSHYGINDFIICAGYKQHVIKEYFANYFLYHSDVTFDFTCQDQLIVHNNESEPWKVTIVNTGLDTMTAGRIKRIQPYVGEDNFIVTYGDAVSDVNINEMIAFSKKLIKDGDVGTLTIYNPGQRYGIVKVSSNVVTEFREKSENDGDLINIGYMYFNAKIFEYINGDGDILEKDILPVLTKEKKLKAYLHKGFWQCMDTKREKDKLEQMWEKGEAKWKIWE